MAEKYHLRTIFGVAEPRALNMGLDVDALFAEMEQDRFEFVSGPSVWLDPETKLVNLTFVFQSRGGGVGH